MLILLPPSEGKDPGGDGPPLDLGTLGFPELTRERVRVLDALTALCRGPVDHALAVLGLSPGRLAEVTRNRALRDAPTLPAARRYTGVLYQRLDLPSLDLGRAGERVVIFSGLWGALRVDDRVPPYRLSADVRLPGLPRTATLWRTAVGAALDPVTGLVVDLRSAGYASMWPGGDRTTAIRVVRDRAGRRTVVSHMAKATRGDVARTLLLSGEDPRTPSELIDLLKEHGWAAEPGDGAITVVVGD
ncbi:YaaA family protein [Rhizohabitans arisaemae]|uniref:YaaA family protein n=1 Tax=Rhizohabitans arisaemae TaxID=2720610 RepID=UPI0024B0710A|nr:peroxide stress protein YaaA [Rhizohabitans arisaemae]